MELIIRQMATNDLTAVTEILKKWNMAPRPEEPDAERSGIDINRTFIAELAGKIVGVASYIQHSPTLAETASLAVDPSVQGLGIGYKLQEARLTEMRSLGIKTVRTETDRPATIRWYMEKFGYRELGKSPKKHEFSLADVNEWTILELDLASGPT